MYEYKVVPAPQRAEKVKGLKTTADRFAHTLAERINAEAAGGWEFLRTETLTCEERRGFTGTRTTTQTVMIFARSLGQVRPDAGAALAAAQGVAHAEDHGHPEADGADWDHEPAPHGWDHAQPRAEPAPERSWDAPTAPAPHAGRRQEPLFRSGAILRGEATSRQEPVLRPRAPQNGDD